MCHIPERCSARGDGVVSVERIALGGKAGDLPGWEVGGGGGDSEEVGATVFLCAPSSARGAGATGGEGRDGNVLFSEEEQIGLRCRRF